LPGLAVIAAAVDDRVDPGDAGALLAAAVAPDSHAAAVPRPRRPGEVCVPAVNSEESVV
jgi:hypothetical protein